MSSKHILYPLGSTIIFRHIITKQQTYQISVIAISQTGDYVASGQKTQVEFQANIITLDFKDRSMMHRLKLYKVINQSLSF
ncbi:unnamed protein product [Paramecium pentaurelia]|uniref:Uncharacterized protein n=1 Tax=Paramecium pentaurelia TaxID=43138 RepID=A0A8S1WTW2_9CILI|nr:unnamed protein product [Paramecium pentaurelia]